MEPQEFDVVVIGAGAVGENVADRTVAAGLRTVIVESDLVGGECSYWACMPSKALLRPAAALRAARAVAGARQAVTGDLDVSAVLARRDAFTHNHDDASQVAWLDDTGISLVRGHARFTGPRQVTVRTDDGPDAHLTARHAVAVCTGSAPLIPDIPGLRGIDPWTSRDATAVTDVPQSLAVVGGGVVAAEMATAFAALGTQVTMVVRSTLLSEMEPFAGDLVRSALDAQGVTVRTGVEAVDAHRTDRNAVLNLSDGGRVVAEHVLVATGRTPRTQDLGLETIGLTPGRWLEADDTLRSPEHDWLYAVGDVTRRALLTHQGKYLARAAGDAIGARATANAVDDRPWGAHVATADHRHVPQVTFTDPEIASVGLTAAGAQEAGLQVRVLDQDLGAIAGASLHADGYAGQARIVVDETRRAIVGATFAGQDVAELLHAATIAIVGEVPMDRLWHAVPAFPTISEVWLRLLEGYGRPTP